MQIEFASMIFGYPETQILPNEEKCKPACRVWGYAPSGNSSGTFIPGAMLFTNNFGVAYFAPAVVLKRINALGTWFVRCMGLASLAGILMFFISFTYHDDCGGFIWPSTSYPCLGTVFDNPLMGLALIPFALGLAGMAAMAISMVRSNPGRYGVVVLPADLASSLQAKFAALHEACETIKRIENDSQDRHGVIRNSLVDDTAKYVAGAFLSPLAAEFLLKGREAFKTKKGDALAAAIYRAGYAALKQEILDCHANVSGKKQRKLEARQFLKGDAVLPGFEKS